MLPPQPDNAAELAALRERCEALARRCDALEQRRGSAGAGANPAAAAPPERPNIGAELARMRREQLGRFRKG